MWPTIIVGAVIAAVFAAVVISEARKRKQGKGSCSCGCSNCGMKDTCHSK